MRIVRIFFSKTGTAAYISHLDLQRVMARGFRISKLPVWYSCGYNPHIYMSFALPLPLGQESVCECVDCKTEAEAEDFSGYVQPLSRALPAGIEVQDILPPRRRADEIASARYWLQYRGEPEEILQAAHIYNDSVNAFVQRKTKRSEETVNLKTVLPKLKAPEGKCGIEFMLPAAPAQYLNPALLTAYLQQAAGIERERCTVTRLAVYTDDGEMFQ